MPDWTDRHLAIIAKMVRATVTGSHHKQRDTIKGWIGGFDGDEIDAAMDDLIADPNAPILEKGRGTISFTSSHDAKAFIENHDEEATDTWYL